MTATEQTEYCELTELPVDGCGCRRHRGGLTVTEQAAADRRAWAERVFTARWHGHCDVCDEPIRPGQQIAHTGDDGGYGRRGHYRHADCKEDE